jgi:hypothetical protein
VDEFYRRLAAGLEPVATAGSPMPFERKLVNLALDAESDIGSKFGC